MFFDTHAHYDDDQFDDDRDSIIRSLPSSGVSLVLNPASNMRSSDACIALAEKYDFFYAAVGVHPHDSKDMANDDIDHLAKMTGHENVKAIGEIGLDYHYDFSPRDIQRSRFYDQLALADKLRLPAIVHEREACADCLDIIKAFPGVKGVVHCFSGSWETAKILLNLGWYISFTGALTFKNARHAPEVVTKMPRDRIMIETDSPYMAPVPVRGVRNDSSNLKYICARAAELMDMSIEDAAALTMKNGLEFFNITL